MNVAGESYDENNFPHKLLLTNTQFSKFRQAFTNDSSANTKLPKTQLNLKFGLQLKGNAIKPLAKSALIPLGLTAAATDAVFTRNCLDQVRVLRT